MNMTRAGLAEFMNQSNDLSEILFGDDIVIDGETITAAVSHPTHGGQLGLGVETLEAILKVRIQKKNLATKPDHNRDTLTYNGETWRVDEVTDDRMGSAWVLTCIPAKQAS
jgi:hypothetical protein